ncbi:MAG: anthranilate synthase component I family protein [Phycisphaeraceae bacterium]|nr:anthranilate synthase component I family protein [Phycisphaeraceae bacterium]MBX3368082.1 anthranilate synthase component I family protein [Phycisphaeraceae bacterium]
MPTSDPSPPPHPDARHSLPTLTPLEAIDAWPQSDPLVALYSGIGSHDRSRWSLLANPSQVSVIDGDVKESLATLLGSSCPLSRPAVPEHPSTAPFGPGWLIAISYEAAASLEPAVPPRPMPAKRPAAIVARISRGWIHDGHTNSWSPFGENPAQLPTPARHTRPGFEIGPITSATGHERFVRTVERAKTYIRDGDVYQVNLSHPLRSHFRGSSRGLFTALASVARPWHGAYLEWTEDDRARTHALASVSPELFLDFDPHTRIVRARPMKGTRTSDDAHPNDLDRSEKDRAELNMIIDLMRNDIGKSCVLGSVRVDQPRTIEIHTDSTGRGLLQATGTVSGTLRHDRSPLDLLWNALPPGSVTGAPKIRAMQIIRELEAHPRHFYCGCIGYLGDDGRLALNVAIRTAAISGDAVEYTVGAGIVADSDPESEWRETLAKAWPIMGLAPG